MKYILSLFLAILGAISLTAQFEYPIKWESSFEQISDTEYNIVMKANIDPGWNIYSQFLDRDDGPIATQFVLESGSHFEKIGDATEEGTIKKAFDQVFDMEVTKIFETATFSKSPKQFQESTNLNSISKSKAI